jgi:hypothetical protein
MLKLSKLNILRCYELVLLCLLDAKDPKVYETYRQSVMRRLAESHDLLKPYFTYKQFGEAI